MFQTLNNNMDKEQWIETFILHLMATHTINNWWGIDHVNLEEAEFRAERAWEKYRSYKVSSKDQQRNDE